MEQEALRIRRLHDVVLGNPELPQILERHVDSASARILADVPEDVGELEGETKIHGRLDGVLLELLSEVLQAIEAQHRHGHEANGASHAVAVDLQLLKGLVPFLHQVHGHASDHVLEGTLDERELPDTVGEGKVLPVVPILQHLLEREDSVEALLALVQVSHGRVHGFRPIDELVGLAAPVVDGPDNALLIRRQELRAQEEGLRVLARYLPALLVGLLNRMDVRRLAHAANGLSLLCEEHPKLLCGGHHHGLRLDALRDGEAALLVVLRPRGHRRLGLWPGRPRAVPLLNLAEKAAQGVDRGAGGHAHALLGGLRRRLEVKALEQADQDGLRLEQSELVTDALTRARAEGQEGVIRVELADVVAALLGVEAAPAALALDRRLPAQRVELGSVLAPELFRPLQRPGRDEDVLPRQEIHSLADALAGGSRGHLVAVDAAADQKRRLRVEAERLQKRPLQERHFLERLPGEGAIAHHGVDLVQGTIQEMLLLRLHELVEGPREEGRRGLVARDEQRHEVVAQLPRGDILAPGADQELQKRHLLAVIRLLLADLLHLVADELIQHGVQQRKILLVILLVAENVGSPREVPVGEDGLRTTLSLTQHGVGSVHHGRLALHGAEVVVEDSLADDVKRDRRELLLHVERGAAGPGATSQSPLEVGAQHVGTLHDLLGGALEPLLVEAGHDGATASLPGDGVRGDEALAHDRLKNLAEDSLGVLLLRTQEDMLDDHWIGGDHHGARPDRNLVEAGVLAVALQEHWHRRSSDLLHPAHHNVLHHGLELGPTLVALLVAHRLRVLGDDGHPLVLHRDAVNGGARDAEGLEKVHRGQEDKIQANELAALTHVIGDLPKRQVHEGQAPPSLVHLVQLLVLVGIFVGGHHFVGHGAH
mmetsp:Transcript_73752/g.190306  ORF Transcript_73752/g.190306 Transcript_73752/m.190306 type:complete len:883 (+) Transcript_73752:544-3192(+)